MKLPVIAASLLSIALLGAAHAADFAVTFDGGYNPAAYPAITASNYTLTPSGMKLGDGPGLACRA